MKRTIIQTALCALGLVALGTANAGSFTTNSPSGQPGNTVTYIVSFAGDGETEDAQLDASFNAGDFSAVVANPALVPGSTCTTPGGNSIRAVPPSGGGVPLTSTSTAYCSYQVTINAAVVAPAALNFTQTFLECADSVAPPPAVCTATLSPVNAVNLSPQYTSAPTAPGGTITIMDPIGGGATTATLTVTNTGDAATTLNVGAATGLSGVLSIAPATAQAIAQGSAGTTYTISCAAAADAVDSQVLSFTHDGSNIPSPVTYTVNCDGVVGPTPPTASLGAVVQPAAGVINQVATGSVPVNVDSAGVATASLALTCTIPATGASAFAVTAGGTRTINAPATVGPNAPDIGVSCVRQAAAVSATLSCAQNATPDPDPAALTAMVTCPAGIVASNFSSNPAPGGTINATGTTGDTVVGTLAVSNAAGTAPLNVSNCVASAGFTLTTAMPLVIPAGASSSVNVTCVAPAPGVTNTGTLTCDHDAPNVASPVTYVLACNGVSGVIPTMGNAGKILLVSLMIGLGLLGMALRRQA